MADSRDMVVAHLIYRRETRALPDLVAGVREGDRDCAAAVADHLVLVVDLVHGHHRAEDTLVWPRLLDRAPAEVAPLVRTMEAQHAALDTGLQDLEARAGKWRDTADAAGRDALATAASRVHTLLTEHLDLEERELLPLIDAHLTAREWAEVASASGAAIPPDKFVVVFGMGLYDATEAMEQILQAPIPAETWAAFAPKGRRAYAEYAERIFGTPEPAHYRRDAVL